jgi:hypothetical protein
MSKHFGVAAPENLRDFLRAVLVLHLVTADTLHAAKANNDEALHQPLRANLTNQP